MEPTTQHIDVDEEFSDTESGLDSLESDTTTMTSSITRYRFENGRRYHAYKDGAYWGPNDEQQNDQMDLFHHIFTLALDGALYLAPISDHPQRIMDIGTGTGIWAMDMADRFPSAEVIGTDLSPTQPAWVPPNLRFEIDDVTQPWTFPKESFDFIHIRCMYGSIADWPALYKEVMEHLKPGGYIEQLEISVVPQSSDGSVTYDSILAKWGRISLELGEKFGKPLDIVDTQRDYIEAAGFEGVVETRKQLPIGKWPRDAKLKELGIFNLANWMQGIEGWSIALLTRVLGWSIAEVQMYLAEMRLGLKNREYHAYHNMSVVYGRKPVNK